MGCFPWSLLLIMCLPDRVCVRPGNRAGCEQLRACADGLWDTGISKFPSVALKVFMRYYLQLEKKIKFYFRQ